MTRGQRWLLWGAAVVSFVSGLAYAAFRYLMRNDDPFSAFNHPAQPWALDVHVLVAPALLFAIGWFWGNHVAPKLRRGIAAGRPSGFGLLALIVVMTASGYLLQTVAEPLLKSLIAWTHGISGILFTCLLAAHRGGARHPSAARSDVS